MSLVHQVARLLLGGCSSLLNLDLDLGRAPVEPSDVHVQVDDGLMAHVAGGTVLQVHRVLVPFHISLARKNLIAQVARELPPLALVDLADVDAEVLLVAEVLAAHAAHELAVIGVGGGRVLLAARRQRGQQELGKFKWGADV